MGHFCLIFLSSFFKDCVPSTIQIPKESLNKEEYGNVAWFLQLNYETKTFQNLKLYMVNIDASKENGVLSPLYAVSSLEGKEN
jgi:hypothetical protein